MPIIRKKKKALTMLGAVLCISLFLGGAMLSGIFEKTVILAKEMPPDDPDFPIDHLFVESTYLLKTGETDDTVNITCTPYLTNIWEKESGEIKIIVYVVKSSNNLADYKSTLEYGVISANSTAELEVPIKLFADTYKVDMLIFEDDLLVLKGCVTIQAKQKFYYDGHGAVIGQDWDVSNSIAPYVRLRE